MGRGASATRASGDPRKRAAAATAAASDHGKRRRVAFGALLVASIGFVAIVVATNQSAHEERETGARGYAAAACDLTDKAEEATTVSTGARYAAAVLLLDRAIIESARAARSEPEFAEMDQAVQALHTAGHRGGPARWQVALDAALAACQDAVG